jgi:hypothetical protein
MIFLEWIAHHWSRWVYVWHWAWPIMEMLHYFGLCLLLGGLFVIDLRLAGLNRRLPLRALDTALPVVYLGFGLNLVTGTLFFIGNPIHYALNPAFQLKMLLVLLAGLNGLYYRLKLRPALAQAADETALPADARIVGALSLLFWIGVVLFGRLIPYVA